MLKELLTYATNSCTPFAREMGYLHEIIAIKTRHQRHKAAWQTHLNHCQQIICHAIDICAQRDTAMVLGSGLLLDIPIDYLTKSFQHVFLVDIVHLNAVKKLSKTTSNIHLLVCDLNGLNSTLPNQQSHIAIDLNQFSPQLPYLNLPADFIISCNVLSQLPIMPRNHIERHYFVEEKRIDPWCQRFITNHLNYLKQTHAHICLITDTTHIVTDSSSQQTTSVDMLYGIKLPLPDQQWRWQIAPQGELGKQVKLHTNVAAYTNFCT